MDYGPEASLKAERMNVKVQRGWLVLSPQATQIVLRTAHDIANEDPQRVIDEIARVLEGATS